jgi:hypothetical protein
MSFHVPNQFRIRAGALRSDDGYGNNGAFMVPNRAARRGLRELPLAVIASDEHGWEHVSVSLPTRCPTWDEMCFIKALFWDESDCVVQFHPPEGEYGNNHAHCLHLWRPTGHDIATPPSWMVGVLRRVPPDEPEPGEPS